MFLADGDQQTGVDHELRPQTSGPGEPRDAVAAHRVGTTDGWTLAHFPALTEATPLVGHWGTELFARFPTGPTCTSCCTGSTCWA